MTESKELKCPPMNLARARSISRVDLTEYLGVEPLQGGANNYILNRHLFLEGSGRKFSILEKAPSQPSAFRKMVNDREIYLHNHILNPLNKSFGPKFLRAERCEGTLFLYFEFENFLKPDFDNPQNAMKIAERFAELFSLNIPQEKVSKDETLLHTYGDLKLVDRLEKLTEFLCKRHQWRLHELLPRLEVAFRRFAEAPKGLCHGDANRGNIMIRACGEIRLIDWSRWGFMPAGVDLGKYLIGQKFGDKSTSQSFFRDNYAHPFAKYLSLDLDEVLFNARCFRAHILVNRASRKNSQNRSMQVSELFDRFEQILYVHG